MRIVQDGEARVLEFVDRTAQVWACKTKNPVERIVRVCDQARGVGAERKGEEQPSGAEGL